MLTLQLAILSPLNVLPVVGLSASSQHSVRSVMPTGAIATCSSSCCVTSAGTAASRVSVGAHGAAAAAAGQVCQNALKVMTHNIKHE
jgi:hypothetical protein